MKRAGIWLAMVWNIVVVLYCFVLFQRCSGRVAKGGKELLECFNCEENRMGNCATGYSLRKSTCLGSDKTCFYKSYYDPFNNGYGGKFKYVRGCTPCETEKCLANATLFLIGLEENLGMMKICRGKLCNFIRMSEFEIEKPIGAKPDGVLV